MSLQQGYSGVSTISKRPNIMVSPFTVDSSRKIAVPFSSGVGLEGGPIVFSILAISICLAYGYLDAAEGSAVDTGYPTANIHALTRIPGLPQIDQFRFFLFVGSRCVGLRKY
jgi:hypothetical protein